MESLMLTSTFVLDRVRKLHLVVGLSDITTAVVMIGTKRQSSIPFYISTGDWELLSYKLPRADRKADATFFHGSYMTASTTPQQQVILSYYPSWLDRLLHREPFSITLNAKATSVLTSLMPTIDAVIDKMRDLTSGGGSSSLTLPPLGSYSPPSAPPPPPTPMGFYKEVADCEEH